MNTRYSAPRRLPRLTLSLSVVVATIFLHQDSAFPESSIPGDAAREVGSFLDFNPAKAGYPRQLDSIVRPLTAALNLIRRDGSGTTPPEGASTVNTSPAPALTREARERLLEAINAAERARDVAPRGLHDEIHLLEGFAFELLGEPKRALAEYDESLKIRSLNPLVSFRRAIAFKLANQCDKALPQLQEVLWMSDRLSHEVLFAQAQCQILLGRADLAVTLLEQARKKSPDYAPVVRLLLETRMRAFDASPRALDNSIAAKMTEDLSAMRAGNPNDPQTSLMLAKLLVRKSDPLVALDDLRRGEQIASTLAERSQFRDDSIVRLVFDAQVKRGDISAAERTLARGLSASPASKPLLDAARQLEVYKEGGL